MKDGAAVRDRVGTDFPTPAHAIEHSKELARRISKEHPDRDPDLSIVVVSEDGAEIHREAVYPGGARNLA
jgi:hypothetical protein